MTIQKPRQIAPGYEPIAGYTLERLIGRGGFGEVWRADAPGGLKKAVKFVFGATEEHRATRELRSLERIKGVHHPFLLTLERFEVVNDQLVIVTELADGSLEDVFKRHLERGSCGIPRAALLAYLHDAADALDYLHQSYQLQHLDIKPGNLLLVGGHVKVADFGLLKDLRDDDCSVVGGLTPVYAPPELFDGRPSMQSDQYSLAVMYQELLTGTRPFSGRTIAQLASQHVNSSPDLEPLPPSDRPVVARALEKSPQRRYPNCKEFVEALRSPRGRTSVHRQNDTETGSDTLVGAMPHEPSNLNVKDLPQLKSDLASDLSRVTGHALVIALGGTGFECLHQLRSRVAKLHAASPLDLHCVLIDTDSEPIYASDLSEVSGLVPPCHTIHTPLRSAMEYRQSGAEHLSSISRRWIYNIPRSKSTEGMRPLGRLALVDNSKITVETLREAIAHLAVVCGERTPHVYVVGSISGGTASGMFLDVAHVLRHLLDEADLHRATVMPVMTMQSLRPDNDRPLAVHDSCAALLEMRHFMQPGNSYPGDTGAGWPSVPAARTPLRNAYIIADLPNRTHADTVETVVDYLWADATGASQLLAAARRVDGDEQSLSLATPSLRSVGVVRLGCIRILEENLLTPATVRSLFLRWLGRPAEAKQIAVPLAERLVRRCGMSYESLLDKSLRLFGPDADDRRSRIQTALTSLSQEQRDNTSVMHWHIISYAEQIITQDDEAAIVSAMLGVLEKELSMRLNDRRVDLTTAIESVRLMIASAMEQAEKLAHEAEHPSVSPDAFHDVFAAMDRDKLGADFSREHLQVACDFAEAVIGTVISRHIAQRLKAISLELAQLHRRLEDLATILAQAIQQLNEGQNLKTNPWDQMPPEIANRFEQILNNLHSHVAPASMIQFVINPHFEMASPELTKLVSDVTLKLVQTTLETLLPSSSNPSDGDTTAINTPRGALTSGEYDVRATIANLKSTDANGTQTLVSSLTPDKLVKPKHSASELSIEASLASARPALLACGGRQRLLLLVGTDAERNQLEPRIRAVHTGALTVTVIPGMTPMLIHEAQQINLDNVIERLWTVSAGSKQVTQRLHSRTDIDWNSASE